jgi:pilus assembly protein CpaF
VVEPADPWAEWNGLLEVIFSRLSGNEHELAAHEAEAVVADVIAQAMEDGSVPAETDRDALATDVLVELTGIGPLADLGGDPPVRTILLNGPRSIYVDRGGEASEKNGRVFANTSTYLRGLARLAQRDADALGDVIGLEEVELDGAVLRVMGTGGGHPVAVWRRFATDAAPLADLISEGQISQTFAQTVVQALIGGRNVLVCGAPSSARATLGSAFAAELGAERRVAVVGDGTGIALMQQNVARVSPNSLLSAGHLAALEAELLVFERLDAGNVAEWVSACLSGGPVLAFFAEGDPERALRRLGLALELQTGVAERGAAIVGEAVDLVVGLQTQVDGSVVVSKLANVEGQKDGFALSALGSARRQG